MSISVESYPVSEAGQNLFPGKSPVEIKFKREDLEIVSTEQGASNTVIINVTTNLTSSLSAGEFIYLNSGDVYDVQAEVISVSATEIRIDTQWLGEGTTGGYINYKQNWYIELDIIDPDNDAIKIIPFTLRDDGDIEGNVTIDLSIINDLNDDSIPDFDSLAEMADSRVKFDIQYREVWRESTGAYTRITNPIILYPAKDEGTIETFNNNFSEPEYYVGYPNGAIFLHSDGDPLGGDTLYFYYDEKNINKSIIASNRNLGNIENSKYGRIFVPLWDLDLLQNTEFITLEKLAVSIPEFNPADFTSDFNIN